MLNIQMEFRKGVLFVRLYNELNSNTIDIFKKEVKEVIINSGILYVVINVSNLSSISKEGIYEIKNLKRIINKMNGKLFIYGGEFKELKTLIKLENELNVFERVVI